MGVQQYALFQTDQQEFKLKGSSKQKTECQSVYTCEGGSLCSIAYTPMDMAKMWHRGYAIAV